MTARRLRVLLLQEDERVLDAVRSDLVEEGFEVICARSFIEAAPFIVGTRVDVLVVYLPQIEWVRRAVVNQIRRANAKLPLIAIAPEVAYAPTEQLGDLGIALILPAQVGRSALVEVIRETAEAALGAR